jgi:hypothetical protein
LEKYSLYLLDVIGCGGAIIVLLTYFLNQTNKMQTSSFMYSALNLAGAVMILASLTQTWNLASVIIEIVWGMISLYGAINYFRTKSQG